MGEVNKCLLPGCSAPSAQRGACTIHYTKFRRLYIGKSPMISEAELVAKGYLTPLNPKPPTLHVWKVSPACREWLEGLGVTILRNKRGPEDYNG